MIESILFVHNLRLVAVVNENLLFRSFLEVWRRLEHVRIARVVVAVVRLGVDSRFPPPATTHPAPHRSTPDTSRSKPRPRVSRGHDYC